MGNYKNFELDFINRTLNIIDQYDEITNSKPFEEQFQLYIVAKLPPWSYCSSKEKKTITFLPKERLTDDVKSKMGLVEFGG